MKDNADSSEAPRETIVTVQFLQTPKPTDTPGLRPEWIDLGKMVLEPGVTIHDVFVNGERARIKKSSA